MKTDQEQLEELRNQQQQLFNTIEKLENKIATAAAQPIIDYLKNLKYDIYFHGCKVIYDKNFETLVLSYPEAGYHFSIPVDENFTIGYNDGDMYLNYCYLDGANYSNLDLSKKIIEFLKKIGCSKDKIYFSRMENEIKSIKQKIKEEEDEFEELNNIKNEIFD